ncbi:rev protein [Simian immunodeficiency virus]|uniref:Protein Rev n=1 Tax=Simian immunodeficiency virus TaxID=11723 RepID=A0A0D4CHL3_SIV|nr:rev protein [Simian immunodeficiency virus]
MAGRSDEDLQELITTIRIIRILYQSNPWPEQGPSRNSNRNRRRRWRSRQRQIDQIAGRILTTHLGRPEELGGVDLPDLGQLHIGDQGPPSNPVDTPETPAEQRT